MSSWSIGVMAEIVLCSLDLHGALQRGSWKIPELPHSLRAQPGETHTLQALNVDLVSTLNWQQTERWSIVFLVGNSSSGGGAVFVWERALLSGRRWKAGF